MDMNSQLQLATVLLSSMVGLTLYKQAGPLAILSRSRGLTGSTELNRYFGLATLSFAAFVSMLLLHRVVRAMLLG